MNDDLRWLLDLEGVPSGLAATRDGIDAMLRDRGLRRTAPELTTESLLRGAVASAILEGSGSDAEAIRAGGGDDIAQGALRVSTELLGLVPVLKASPLQALARIHALAGGAPADQLGRPKDAEGAGNLRTLVGVLNADAPALLVAAVTHAGLMTAQPFASRNGLVARAVERLVLVARGLDEKSLVVTEQGHLANRAAYESNLRGYASGSPSGVHSWLLYCTEAYTSAAEASPLRD